MERQPLSKLEKFQRKYAVLGALIDKRRAMLQSAPSWNISHDDPDIEAAMRNHAKEFIGQTIPESIARLEKERLVLRDERAAYIQEHAEDFLVQAEDFDSLLGREQKAVKILSQNLKRGFTTQDVVDRRIANLQALETRRDTDPELQAGFELIAQQKQAEEGTEVTEEMQKEEQEIPFLPPLLDRLRSITFQVENLQPGSTDLVDYQLRIAKETEKEQLTDAQKQLLEDAFFIEGIPKASDYKRALTPEELHEVITKFQEYIKDPSVSDQPNLSKDFKRRILEFADQYTGYSGRVTKKDIRKAKEALEKSKKIDRLNDLAETASLRLIQIIYSPAPSQNFRIKANLDSNQASLYQAALDLACYDIYQKRKITPSEKIVDLSNFNKAQVDEWHVQAGDVLSKLRRDDRIAPLINDLENTIFSMEENASEQSNIHSLTFAINLQLKIGHLVNDIKNKLVFIQALEVARKAELSRDRVYIEELSGDIIPSLLPKLDHIASMHEHKYNLDNTVGRKAQEAHLIEPEKRTPQEQQLLEDIAILSQFTTFQSYKDIYTPNELHDLVVKLQLLSQKNRPDFNELEDRILELLDEQARVAYSERSAHLVGLIKRADRNDEKRRGMQWDTLKENATKASGFIIERMTDRSSAEMMSYFVSVKDPHPQTYPDLTPVYQLVANIHALDVIAKRSIRVDSARKETFVANCQVINDWYQEILPIINGLPDDPQVIKLSFQIGQMVETMNIRLEGKQSTGFDKDYKLDPAGAISLQKKIGHTVEELKAHLNELSPSGIDEGVIIPLE